MKQLLVLSLLLIICSAISYDYFPCVEENASYEEGHKVLMNTRSCTPDDSTLQRFHKWCLKEKKVYKLSSNDLKSRVDHRYCIYKSNLARIEAHNKGGHTYTLRDNSFADLSHEEWMGIAVTPVQLPTPEENIQRYGPTIDEETTQDDRENSLTVDRANYTAPIRDTRSCPVTTVYVTVAQVMSDNAPSYGNPPMVLSPQMIADCANGPTCQDTQNTLSHEIVYDWIKNRTGLCLEGYCNSSYPIFAPNGTEIQGPCRNECVASCMGGTRTFYPIYNVYLRDNRELTQNKTFLTRDQQLAKDVSRIVQATFLDMSGLQLYGSGIYVNSSCADSFSTTTTNSRSVTVVGYSISYGSNFFKVQNSMGYGWGENGLIRIGRLNTSNSNLCSLAVYYSSVCTKGNYPMIGMCPSVGRVHITEPEPEPESERRVKKAKKAKKTTRQDL